MWTPEGHVPHNPEPPPRPSGLPQRSPAVQLSMIVSDAIPRALEIADRAVGALERFVAVLEERSRERQSEDTQDRG